MSEAAVDVETLNRMENDDRHFSRSEDEGNKMISFPLQEFEKKITAKNVITVAPSIERNIRGSIILFKISK